VIDSTRVALNYFSTLYRKFDKDWFVALAAYNTGDGNITKAIAKNRKRKKSTDYWSLPLKQEPKQYIPKLLALTQIFSNPEKYGIKLEPIPDKPRVALVKTGGQIDLKLAAKLAGTNLTTLRKLNPGYKRWATNPSGPHHLLVPASLAENFNKNIAKLPPDKRIRLKKHHVKAGETLKTIAKSHKTDSYLIRKLNKLKGKNIKVDQKLLIPVAYTQEEIIALGEHEVGDDGSTRLATKDPSNESETETETPNSDLVTSLLKGLLQTP
jgi:membrane-bound lytic murein transglycosylase D